ncbi:MAG: VWA domain-containing protein [Planctomycetes bacterium]|nr:VWA domain-containing protein [Planctomycetota bacterium]
MQLPDNLVATEFGEVNVTDQGLTLEVRFTILLEPQGEDAIDWQTGVALDGSFSMLNSYGKHISISHIPESQQKMLERTGVLTWREAGNRRIPQIKDIKWIEELLIYRQEKNIVQEPAREFIRYLASLDADQHTTAIYWSCSNPTQRPHNSVQIIGDFPEHVCSELKITGPDHFGSRTELLPAVQYFADRFVDAEHGMYIFITDGKWRDQIAVKRYTQELASAIAAGKRNHVKFVIIGLGIGISETQMIELDDLEAKVDIWDHKMAADFRDLPRLVRKIWAEPERPNLKVANSGVVRDSNGKTVATYPNHNTQWLPAEISFNMSKSCDFFTLEVPDYNLQIRQTVVLR